MVSVVQRVKNIFKKEQKPQTQSSSSSQLPAGTPIGTGIGGGTLVTTEGGGVAEVPMSSTPDIGRPSGRGGGGGGGKGYGSYVSEEGFQSGFATSTGQFYPTRSSSFVPKGFARGTYTDFAPAAGTFILTAPAGFGGGGSGKREDIFMGDTTEGLPIFPQQSTPASFLLDGKQMVNIPRTETEFKQRFVEKTVKQYFSSLSPESLRQLSFVEGSGISGQSTLSGERFFFQPSGTLIGLAESRADISFSKLSPESRETLIMGGRRIGAQKFAIETAELPVELFKEFSTGGTFKKGDAVGFSKGIYPADVDVFGSLPFGVGQRVREIKAKPFGAAEASSFYGLGALTLVAGFGAGGSMFKGYRAQGFTRTKSIGLTAGEFSPVKIKSGTYFSPTPERFDIVSFKKITPKGEERFIIGRGGDTQIVGFEKAIKVRGVNFREFKGIAEQPFIDIKGGGAYIETGIRTTGIKQFSLPEEASARLVFKSSRPPLFEVFGKEFGGALSKTVSRVEFDFFRTERFGFGSFEPSDIQRGLFGSISRGKGDITKFLSGRARVRRELRIRKGGRGGVETITRVSPNIRGFEISLPSSDISSGVSVGGRVLKLKTKKSPFNLDITEVLKGQNQLIKGELPFQKGNIFKPSKSTAAVITQQKSIYEGLGQYERTGDIAIQIPRTSQASFQALNLDKRGLSTFQPLKAKGKTQIFASPLSSLQVQSPLTATGEITSLIPFATEKTGTITKQKTISKLLRPTPSTTGFDFDLPFYTPPRTPFLPIMLPELGFLEFPKGKAKGKRKFERTPTLFSLEFGLKAQRKDIFEETGLVRRPILSSGRRRRKKR